MARQDSGSDIDELDYEKDITINKDRLDREFVTHPKKHMKYASLAAQATKELSRAHEKVKVVRSEIIIEVLAKGDKPTGAVLEALYRTDKRHLKAKEEMIDAEETAQLLNEAVLAFRARRNALENLAQLMLSGYFSAPKAPEGSGIGDSQSEADASIREKINNRK